MQLRMQLQFSNSFIEFQLNLAVAWSRVLAWQSQLKIMLAVSSNYEIEEVDMQIYSNKTVKYLFSSRYATDYQTISSCQLITHLIMTSCNMLSLLFIDDKGLNYYVRIQLCTISTNQLLGWQSTFISQMIHIQVMQLINTYGN